MTSMAVVWAFPNIVTDHVAVTRDFYIDLLELQVSVDSDWFATLTTGDPRPTSWGPDAATTR